MASKQEAQSKLISDAPQLGAATSDGDALLAPNSAQSKLLLSIVKLGCCTDIDTKNFQEQYEAACWKIVDEMQEKFIDLCVDDNHSAYGN